MMADSHKRDRVSTTTRWEKGFVASCRLEKISHASYIIIMATWCSDLSTTNWILTNDAVLTSQMPDIEIRVQSPYCK
jgi:hypothetical protein